MPNPLNSTRHSFAPMEEVFFSHAGLAQSTNVLQPSYSKLPTSLQSSSNPVRTITFHSSTATNKSLRTSSFAPQISIIRAKSTESVTPFKATKTMSAFPDRKMVSRPRNLGERSQTLTLEKSRRERGPSSMSSPSQDASLGRARESGRPSDNRRPDYITQGPPLRDKAARGDRYDRSEGHARDGIESYSRSGASSYVTLIRLFIVEGELTLRSDTGGSSSPAVKAWNNKTSPLASRSTKEERPPVPKSSKEESASPALRSTTQGLSDSTSKSTESEASSSASRFAKEEYYSLGSKSTNEVVSTSSGKNPNGGHWTPKDRASRGGTGLPRSKVVENEIIREEEQLSGPTLGSAVQRLSRPGHATSGYEVNLQTNCFEIKLDPSIQLYQYHIHVLPEPNTARQRHRAFDLFLKHADFLNPLRAGGCHPVVATDCRSTLITTTRIYHHAGKEDDRHQCIVPYYEVEEGASKKTPSIQSHIFTVSFCQPLPLQRLIDYLGSTTGRALSKVNGSILHALSLVVARKPLKITDTTKTNNEHKFFPYADPLAVLDGGLIALQGFQASVRVMGSRLFINVNPRTGIFYREDKNGTLLDLMNEFRDSDQGMKQMQEFVKGIRVSLPHLGSESSKMRIKTVSGLASGPILGANANEVSFRWNDKEVTVADYYKQSEDNLRLHAVIQGNTLLTICRAQDIPRGFKSAGCQHWHFQEASLHSTGALQSTSYADGQQAA